MPPLHREIPLQQLHLDTSNPRLPKSLSGTNESRILEYMLLDASLIELMLAIGKNGFFPGEQLLVVNEGGDSYKVVEGNRRLSALKLLSNPGLATVQNSKIQQVIEETDQRPTEIPCLIFENEASIHNYLGYRHITGIKEWKLLEKARYLYELWHNTEGDQPLNVAAKELAKSIGSRSDYVKRILIGYEIYIKIEEEAFFRIPGLDDTTFFFNYIADSLNRPNIAAFLGIDIRNTTESYTAEIDEANLENWTRWLFEKNREGKTRLIGDSESLSALNQVLGNDAARAAFVSGRSLEESLDLTDEINTQFLRLILNSLNQLEQADRIVTRASVGYDEVLSSLREIRTLASKIGRTIQEREDESEL